MFKKRDNNRDKKPRERGSGKNDLADMLGIGGSMMPDDDEDDESLEAELAALQGRPVTKKRKDKKNEKLMSIDQITKLADDSMKDIDDDISDDDLEGDDDLMGELNDILGDDDDDDDDDDNASQVTGSSKGAPAKVQSNSSGPVKTLEDRKQMYTTAIQNAKTEGSSSKARRYDRGLKEIDRLLKLAKAGKPVNEDDIPPPVVVKGSTLSVQSKDPEVTVSGNTGDVSEESDVPQAPKPAPRTTPSRPIPAPRPTPPSTMEPEPVKKVAAPAATIAKQDNSATLTMLGSRRDEYKQAALQKKREGDIPSAKQLLGISKKFDSVISSVENGEDVDLSDIPPPPSQLLARASSAVKAKHTEFENKETDTGTVDDNAQHAEPVQDVDPAQSVPTTMLGALEQRLEKYNKSAEQAKAEGNGSKARRMGRIVKQYQDAIKAHKAGRSFDAEELPTPPGFGPLPGMSTQPPTTSAAPSTNVPTPPKPSEIHQSAATPAPSAVQPAEKPLSRNEKELQFLLQRQNQFKIEALNAKKAGNIESAKDYLRQAKGLDAMIASAQNGLRVDITTVPKCTPFATAAKTPPSITTSGDDDNEDFEFLSTDELQRSDSYGEREDVYSRLQQALKGQIETSTRNVEHYRLLGDLPTAQNFLALQKSSQQDLDSLKAAKAHGEPIPKFHYENKSFPVVRSHPQLSDSEVEICVLRCINIPLPSDYQPKDMYVYVNYEFPFPTEGSQSGNTETIKHTINPEYNQNFKVTIDRKSRALARVFRRQGITFTVMYQRGFLKSDKALGQANIKLEKLMNKCKIHECVNLMDTERGRKAVGGKIEVMIKLREPLVDKDAEVVQERWLVLDTHLRSFQMRARSAYGGQRPTISADTYESLEVLKLEKDIADKKISALKSQGKSPPASIVEESKSLDTRIKDLHGRLVAGGIDGMKDYLQQLEGGQNIEKTKAQNFLKAGDKTSAKLCLAKKKLLDKEIAALKQRIK